jgi:hypothetical protein
MIQIISLKRITPACPSQWEGTTADGETILIRYRSTFSVSYMRPPILENHRFRLDPIFERNLTAEDFGDGEPYDDSFVEFPTARSVLAMADILVILDDGDIPDEF